MNVPHVYVDLVQIAPTLTLKGCENCGRTVWMIHNVGDKLPRTPFTYCYEYDVHHNTLAIHQRDLHRLN